MPMAIPDFADMVWLFTCDNRNRGILNQNFDEAALLWRAVRESDGPILEVGRRQGGATALMLAAGHGRTVTSIDLIPAHDKACQYLFDRIQEADPERLELLVGDSRKPLDGHDFGFLFMDGDDSYEGARADVAAHWPSLRPFNGVPGGVVFHNAMPNKGLAYQGRANHAAGVTSLCHELIECGAARAVEAAGSSLWMVKQDELPYDF